MTRICRDCGTVGETKTVTRGSMLIELVLWLCFIVPGLIYSIWRLTTRYEACPKCGGRHMLPVSSPIGTKLAAEVGYSEPLIQQGVGAENFGRIIGRWFSRR